MKRDKNLSEKELMLNCPECMMTFDKKGNIVYLCTSESSCNFKIIQKDKNGKITVLCSDNGER